MNHFKVQQALISAYRSGAFFSDTNTAYENVEFTPPLNTPWAKVTFMPAGTRVFTLGPTGSGRDEFVGFLQVDINTPLNSGVGAAWDLFVAIRSYFYAGRKFEYQSQQVICRPPTPSPARNVDGFCRISATIPFYSHINR